jgi:trehalose/maltose hydrolase-like predicted phosphorylase
MNDQKAMDEALKATDDPSWRLQKIGYDPLSESNLETRFAISNGFLGVRGSLSVNRNQHWVIPPRTYVAGLFDTPDGENAVPELLPAADWLQVKISARVDETRPTVDLSSYRLTLDMGRAAMLVDCRLLVGNELVARLRTSRLVSISDRALGLQLIAFEVEKGELDLTLEASCGDLGLGLTPVNLGPDLCVWRTKRSGKFLAIATAAALQIDGREQPSTALGEHRRSWTWRSCPGQVVSFERLVAFSRSDSLDADSGTSARSKLDVATRHGWRGVFADHVKGWADRWHFSDVEIDGDPDAQQALRFAVYHLNSAANPEDDRVSIGARALTGDDYHGHVFWDTEIYLVPFYAMTWPETARALLMYRFHTLDAARAKADRMGWRGALYAWESADTGEEATPRQAVGPDRKIVNILSGKQEQHVSADIAYAIWQYWQATGDESFLQEAGAEILLETGRFWSSRAKQEADGSCHIRGVIGPDEYHENIDDNAFTNVMARWNIRRALDVAVLLRERWPNLWTTLSLRLRLDEAELKRWRVVADAIAVGLDVNTGLLEQFAGFFGLEDIDLSLYEGRSVPMDVVLGPERTQRSQVVKQADVVALLGLLPEEFDDDEKAKNFNYYEVRCSHGSSLSRAMHGVVAARLGLSEKALGFFRQTTGIDLADSHVAIAGGIHIAALGGVWQIALLGFAGLSLTGECLSIDPKLPASWRGMKFRIQWHGRRLMIAITHAGASVEATLEKGAPMTIRIRGEAHDLRLGKSVRLVGSAFQQARGYRFSVAIPTG